MVNRNDTARSAVAIVLLALAACGGGAPNPPASSASAESPAPSAPQEAAVPAAAPADEAEEPLPPSAVEAALPEEIRQTLFKPFTGDFDGMVERRVIRVGVAYNRTFYFVDRGVQRGMAYEFGKAFEEQLNRKLKTSNATKVHVFFVPLPRGDQMVEALTGGKVDVLVAQVTVRPELQAIADFTIPTRKNVSEVVVTGPGAPAIATVDDLSGKRVSLRRDSAPWASLLALNERFEQKGLSPVVLHEVPSRLEDDDLLEMVNAGLLPMVIVQDYLAEFWKKIFPNITVHDTVAVRTGATLALPIRKNSPRLAAELNGFIKTHGLGTAFGNVIEKRYLVSTTLAKGAASEAERKKFLSLVAFFKKYAKQYDQDYLLMAAQGYQESQLNHDAKSHVGAIGVMQIMPATGKDMNVGDIREIESNIHAGVKYIRFMQDQYFGKEPMDTLNKALFAFAAYNAGPARVRQLRKEAATRGLDPNVWFGNVEQIDSERIGRETVTYVANIYKYYIAYKLIVEEQAGREEAKAKVRQGTP